MDFCALEPVAVNEEDDDEDEWTDWDRDPWLLGADSWTSGAKVSPVFSAQHGKELLTTECSQHSVTYEYKMILRLI